MAARRFSSKLEEERAIQNFIDNLSENTDDEFCECSTDSDTGEFQFL